MGIIGEGLRATDRKGKFCVNMLPLTSLKMENNRINKHTTHIAAKFSDFCMEQNRHINKLRPSAWDWSPLSLHYEISARMRLHSSRSTKHSWCTGAIARVTPPLKPQAHLFHSYPKETGHSHSKALCVDRWAPGAETLCKEELCEYQIKQG